LADIIIENLYNLFGIDKFIKKAKESIVSLIDEIDAKLDINIKDVAKITLKRIEKKESISDKEYFLNTFDLIENIAVKKGLNIVVAIDEFQDIVFLDEKILDPLRSVLQQHRNVTYLFAGSIESIMNRIFTDKSSPFFHFAQIITLNGLNIKELFSFVNQYFKKQGIKINSKELKNLLTELRGHPYYSMKVLQKIDYLIKVEDIKEIDKNIMLKALKESYFEVKSYIEDILAKVRQKKHHFEVLYESANKINSSLESDILYKTRKSLQDMGLLKKVSKGEYVLTDIFMEFYLKDRFE
jgi:hypothetical protein